MEASDKTMFEAMISVYDPFDNHVKQPPVSLTVETTEHLRADLRDQFETGLHILGAEWDACDVEQFDDIHPIRAKLSDMLALATALTNMAHLPDEPDDE